MLEVIAKTGLLFGNVTLLAPIILIGLFTQYRDIFARCAFLVLFTIVYNIFLKSIWQAPLPPPMEGWAFPSGHMHTAVVFWGWLAVEFHKRWFYELIALFFVLLGYGMIHEGYHYPIDVVGALGFGSLSILLTHFINRLDIFKQHSEYLGFLFLFLSIGIFLILPPEAQKPHVIKALGILLMFSGSWAIFKRIPRLRTGEI